MKEIQLYCGIDIVEINRIRKSLDNKAGFLMRFFGDNERRLFESSNSIQRVAAAFAAKEAFGKAIKTGIAGFSLKEVELLRSENGAPYLSFSGKAKQIVDSLGYSFDVSVSHSENYATAMVIAYKAKGE